MASQGTHPQNINDFDLLTYDSTLGDCSFNTTSDSLNDTFVNVNFQQHEYDHDQCSAQVFKRAGCHLKRAL